MCRRVTGLASDNHVEERDDEERDGKADGDVKDSAFYATSRSVDGSFCAAKYASQAATPDLQEDDTGQRDADDDLGNAEIDFHSESSNLE
jgi:hypothetical protein